MTAPTTVLLARFRTRLSHDEVVSMMEERAPAFRALEGLRQKYYLHDPASGEYAGLYLWDSEEALDAYRRSELRATIADAYEVEGEPKIEVFRVFEELRPDAG